MPLKYYDKYFENAHLNLKERTAVWKIISSYLQRYIPHNAKIIDLGCGYCDFINTINGREKHALDVTKKIKSFAGKNVKIHIQSCTNLRNFEKDSFDVVFTSNLFEHLKKKDFEKTLEEIYLILKPKGKLIIIQPNFKYAYKEYFDDYTHENIYTHISMSEILKSHKFKIKKIVPRFLPFSMKTKARKAYFILKMYLRSPIKPFAKQMLIISEK